MEKEEYVFTSESVTIGHPDKTCDLISDAVLDAYLAEDRNARVACEVMFTATDIIVSGEITSTAHNVDILGIVCDTLEFIGNKETFNIQILLNKQSPEIAHGVDHLDGEIGAGDQGLMFGYACDETDAFMPTALYLSHLITDRLVEYRKDNPGAGLEPDGKAQVSVRYIDGVVQGIDTIVVSTQHNKQLTLSNLRPFIEGMVKDVFKWNKVDLNLLKDTKFLINPAGTFHIGGSEGDCGLTGRKIIVDTYGGSCPHGGGAFSGKDPTKVDRSAAYMARYIAKNIVASGITSEAKVQLSYAIGVVEPVSVFIDCKSRYTAQTLEDAVRKCFNLTPGGIIEELDLLNTAYFKTAQNGHFGKSDFTWERLDKVQDILECLKDSDG